MANEQPNCPNCGTAFKQSFLGTVEMLPDNKIKLINEFIEERQSSGYCTKCGKDLFERALGKLSIEKKTMIIEMRNLLPQMLVISTHMPHNWDYDIKGMVTGQSTTGTGVLSEFTSSFTDLFGLQSDSYNSKLREGEELCFSQLRKKALELDANAIIATDIDYSEVGGDKGMLMVCMAGTAIRLKNVAILGDTKRLALEKLGEFHKRIVQLDSIVKDFL